MANPLLQAALKYSDMGFSVIPLVPGGKNALIKWEPFKKTRPTKSQISSWWSNSPDANIGIVTGQLSRLFAVDVDSQEGENALVSLGFDSIMTPTVKTPRGGSHLYCQFPDTNPPLTVGVGLIPGTDFRGEGGYIVAPPSTNGKGKKYEWVIDLDCPLSVVPQAYLDRILSLLKLPVARKTEDDQRIALIKGHRDDDLFYVANWLIKGGKEEGFVRQILRILAKNCDPPFPENEVERKIESALGRQEKRQGNLASEIREFVASSSGIFSLNDVYAVMHMSSREDKKYVSTILKRLADEKIIEKTGAKHGYYRLVETSSTEINWKNANIEPLDVKLPLGVHEFAHVHRSNVIIVAGESNSGKTAFCLNAALLNRFLFPVKYMTSEMQDGAELKLRLQKFQQPLSVWDTIKFTFQTDNFPDHIDPDGFNIIDYLDEGTDAEAYKMPMRIRLIADRLKSGVAIIAIQKDPAKMYGFGGAGTLNRSRIYLTIGGGVLTIVKAKIWRDETDNPNGKHVRFKLGGGCRFKADGDWENK